MLQSPMFELRRTLLARDVLRSMVESPVDMRIGSGFEILDPMRYHRRRITALRALRGTQQ